MPDQVRHDRHKLSTFLNYDTASKPESCYFNSFWTPATGSSPAQAPPERLEWDFIRKHQYSMLKTFGISNFGHCDLFGICNLGFKQVRSGKRIATEAIVVL
jgi:hypothetical protein